MRALLFSLLLLLYPATAVSEPLDAGEQARLDSTRDSFVQSMLRGDFEYAISFIPPKILNHIAASAGIPVEDLIVVLPGLMEKAMAGASFSDYRMVTEDLDATRVVSDGDEYIWGFAPSSIEFTVEGRHFIATGQTFVLLDSGSWYLVRTSETDKVEMLRGLYPFLNAVEFPEETLSRAD